MAEEEEEKEYRWETGYEKTWYSFIYYDILYLYVFCDFINNWK